MEKLYLTQAQCQKAAASIAEHWRVVWDRPLSHNLFVYGVPRGGIPVAYLVRGSDCNPTTRVVEKPEDANLIVDDIIDSGATRDRYHTAFPNIPFLALTDFLDVERNGAWVVFPWEKGDRDQSADDVVTRLLQFIGEDPNRGGLKDTPQRVLKAWKEWTSGYGQDPATVIKWFEDGSENYDEMVFVKDIPFYSHCEHHLAPFFGTATIAYLPDKRVIGLSKLGRVLEIFARRLQVQERMTTQIADALNEHLKPLGVGVLVRARHMCMESRGLSRQGHHTVTSALRGKFFLDPTVRSEFLAIA